MKLAVLAMAAMNSRISIANLSAVHGYESDTDTTAQWIQFFTPQLRKLTRISDHGDEQ